MLRFSGVNKSYNGQTVLENFEFSLGKGERIGLLGDSGIGKSTILRLVAGLEKADSGIVEVGSKHIGYIFQEHRLIPWRSAEENVAFSLIAGGMDRKEALAQARSYLEKVELRGYEHYYPGQLSGGMCQRVSIARAFVIRPDILLMDEPFSALDPALKQRMNALVSGMLAETPASTIYVTHNIDELDWVNRIYTVKKGGVLERYSAETANREVGLNEMEMKKHLNLDMEKMEKILDIKLRIFRKELSKEEAKSLVNKTCDRVSAQEFAYGEQQILDHGITDEAMLEEMDDIIDIFRDVLESDEETLPPGHPIQSYRAEADELEKLTRTIEEKLSDRFILNQWLEIYDQLGEINTHFSRKQHQLFSILEKKGFDRPSKVMWTFDNRVRDAISASRKLLETGKEKEFLAAQEEVVFLVRDILEKERDVLYPTSLKLIDDREFAEMRRGDDEIGYCLIDNPPDYTVAGSPSGTGGDEAAGLLGDLAAVLQKHGVGPDQSQGVLDVATGKLSLEQINLIFRHLPVDFSFVDEDDLVKFYSDTKHRVFPRSPGVIGRKVEN